ncbi:MAG: MBL fold metallo-hydrolase [Myxococcota bacterium]
MGSMEVQFWGVRGSVPVPGAGTQYFGGNTSCVEVRCGEQRIVLDAGTGLRALGNTMHGDADVTLLLSHLHWDHIQGLPFFTPLYRPTTRLTIYGASDAGVPFGSALARQMCPPNFPVQWTDLPAAITTHTLSDRQRFRVGDVTVRCVHLDHPGGGVLAYRLTYDGHSVVYATDIEQPHAIDRKLRELAEGADVLIFDSQYTPEEYRGEDGPSRVGWGHSTYEAGAALARQASVGEYVLFHHDPSRQDEAMIALEGRAGRLFHRSRAAREGLVMDIKARQVTHAS